MGTTSISLTEYLNTQYEPDAEFVGGVVEERNVGEYDHNAVQRGLLLWFARNDKAWGTRSIQEQRTRLRTGNVRVPDISVFDRSLPIEQVFTSPQLIAIEVLSPEDRQIRAQQKILDYLEAGVKHVWVIDPAARTGWDCSTGDWIAKERLTIEGTPIYLSIIDLFQQIDADDE